MLLKQIKEDFKDYFENNRLEVSINPDESVLRVIDKQLHSEIRFFITSSENDDISIEHVTRVDDVVVNITTQPILMIYRKNKLRDTFDHYITITRQMSDLMSKFKDSD